MSLKETITALNLTDLQAMNLLQDRGIISDLCVTVKDVAEADAKKAALWLNLNHLNAQPGQP